MLGADYERHFTILPVDQTKDGPISITFGIIERTIRFLKLSKEEQSRYRETYRIGFPRTPTRETDAELLNRDIGAGLHQK